MSGRNKYKDLTKNTALFALSTFGARFINFILLPLYTYILTTEEYGTIDLVLTAVQLLLPILTLNIQDAVLRFAIDKENDSNDVISVAVKLIVISSIPLGIVLLILRGTGIIKLDQQYLVYLFVTFIANATYNSFSMYLKAVNKVKIFAVAGLVHTLSTGLLNLLLLLVVRMGVTGYLIANCSGTIIAIILMFTWGGIYKSLRTNTSNKQLIRLMVLYSSPLIANSLAWWLNNASDRYILTYYCGTALNGIYAISYKIPTILSTIQNIFYNAWSISAITEFDKEDRDGFIGNIYSLYSSACILVCSIILLLNIPVASILYSKDFFEAWHYVPMLLVGTVFNGLALFEGCIFTAVKQTKTVSSTTVVGAVVNTALNFLLIPKFGAYGAAFATMVGYITIWGVRAIRLRNVIRMKIKWKSLIPAVCALFIQCFLAEFNGSKFVVLQVLIILSILFFLRSMLKELLHTIFRRVFRK